MFESCLRQKSSSHCFELNMSNFQYATNCHLLVYVDMWWSRQKKNVNRGVHFVLRPFQRLWLSAYADWENQDRQLKIAATGSHIKGAKSFSSQFGSEMKYGMPYRSTPCRVAQEPVSCCKNKRRESIALASMARDDSPASSTAPASRTAANAR